MKVEIQNFFFCYMWSYLTDVWMEYIKFEQERGDARRVSEIYMRAVKNLDPTCTDSFVTEFSLLKTGMTVSQDRSS
jgi:hypothetical protein